MNNFFFWKLLVCHAIPAKVIGTPKLYLPYRLLCLCAHQILIQLMNFNPLDFLCIIHANHMVVKAKSVYSTLIMIFIDHVGFVKWDFSCPFVIEGDFSKVRWDNTTHKVQRKILQSSNNSCAAQINEICKECLFKQKTLILIVSLCKKHIIFC